MNPVLDALDKMECLTICLEAVTELINPEPDLHLVSREKQALLLSYLLEQQRFVQADLSRALKHDQASH